MAVARVLKQVRENRHFDLPSVARAAHISPARLEEFEQGERSPSYKQLERLAEVYGLPDYVLSAPTLPNLPETIIDYRRRIPKPARLSPEGMQRIWAAEQAASFTNQLLAAIKIQPPTWSNAVPTGKPTTKTALSLRKYFDDWLVRRRAGLALSGTPEQTFFAALRIFLEAQGTLVRVNDAPADDFLGFFLKYEHSTPTIFVNRRTSAPKAQLFTIVHEIAHRMLDVSGVSDPFQLNNDVERTCNKFAAEFLAPEEYFRAIVERQSRSARSNVFILVDAVSQQSLLSKHATAIRLLETEYLDQRQLGAWTKARATMQRKDMKQEESDASGETFGQPHAKRIGELGYLAIFAAKAGVDAKFIDQVDITSGISLSRTLQEKAFSLATRRMVVARS